MAKGLILPLIVLISFQYEIKCEELGQSPSSAENVRENSNTTSAENLNENSNTISTTTSGVPTSLPRPRGPRPPPRPFLPSNLGRSKYPSPPGFYPTPPLRRPWPNSPSSYPRGGSQVYPQRRYPDHYHVFPHYYSPEDTGNDVFGIYMGAKLANLRQPTFSNKKFYTINGQPRYDHYSIDHYHHRRMWQIPPALVRLSKNTTCTGDSAEACPRNTTSLCIPDDGKLMCIADDSQTSPCEKIENFRCVWTTIPCANNPSAGCKDVDESSAVSVELPCFHNLTLEMRDEANDNNASRFDGPERYNTTSTYCVTFAATPTPGGPSYSYYQRNFPPAQASPYLQSTA